MSDNIILSIAILVSGLIGAYIGKLKTSLKSSSEKSTLEERNTNLQNQLEEQKNLLSTETEKLQVQFNTQLHQLKDTLGKVEENREDIRREKDFLSAELTRKATELGNLQQQNVKRDAEFEERQDQLRKDFELLAQKILDEKSEKFTIQNRENIKQILSPLQDKIQGFEKKVEDSQKESISIFQKEEQKTRINKQFFFLEMQENADWSETYCAVGHCFVTRWYQTTQLQFFVKLSEGG